MGSSYEFKFLEQQFKDDEVERNYCKECGYKKEAQKEKLEMPLLKVDDFKEYDQYEKIFEEQTEFWGSKSGIDEISEALDNITSIFTLLTHKYTKNDIAAALIAHENKLLKRGWQTKGTIKIELEETA